MRRPADTPEPGADAMATGQLVAGIALVAVGILFFGQQIDLWDGWSFRRLWPIILIVVGFRQTMGPRTPADRRWGWMFMAMGGVLLLHTTQILSLRQSWPLFIVMNGVAILVGGLTGRRCRGSEGASHGG